MAAIPTDKLRKGNGVVLSLGGALNPPHLGHVAMMERAKRIAEAQGLTVLGGYLSPSSDGYVRGKRDDWAAPLDLRAAMCAEAVRDSDWLMSTNLGIPLQTKTAGAIGRAVRRPVRVVMGSDVAERWSEESKRRCIVVDRTDQLSSSRIIDHSDQHQWEAVKDDMHPRAYALWRGFCDDWERRHGAADPAAAAAADPAAI